MVDQRVGAVVITWNRREEALTSLGRLLTLPERPHVVLVDNGSGDGIAQAVTAASPEDAHPRLAVVTARILTEPGGHDDPIVEELRDSPVPGPSWLPGPVLGSFLAGASVVRREVASLEASQAGSHARRYVS
ncbi:glycosyltransferase family 2 protein [Nonomuraea sp. 3N208]|uniref:glycosyltransferase family 2 protein n=1 Tax=Nonomuraea sp. 3N208 TaxID=3457421 RepID=UPI003FCE8C3D